MKRASVRSAADRAEAIIEAVRSTNPARADDLADMAMDRLATCADCGMSEAAAVALAEIEKAVAAQGGTR